MTDIGQELVIGPTRAEIRKAIIQGVLRRHDIEEGVFFGPSRTDDVVAARMDAAHRLRAAGFSTTRIGDILKRDHTVICYYFSKDARDNNRARSSLRRRHRMLSDDIRAVIDEIARLENVTPHVLMAQWINERARYEIEARARDTRAA